MVGEEVILGLQNDESMGVHQQGFSGGSVCRG
jgi:hypothetical protein